MSLQLDFHIFLSLDGTRNSFCTFVNFGVESFCLKISLDVFKSRLKWWQNLWNLVSTDGSEQLAFGLEDQKIGLFFDVENVVVQQEIAFSFLGHFVDKWESFIEVIIFVDGLKEEWEHILVSFLDVDQSRW